MLTTDDHHSVVSCSNQEDPNMVGLVLQDRYGGFLGMQLVPDFAAYARTVVAALGERVVYWTTFNEPQSICLLGFGYGSNAPGMLNCHFAHLPVGVLLRGSCFQLDKTWRREGGRQERRWGVSGLLRV